MAKINRIQTSYMNRGKKLGVQAMETATVAKFTVDFFKHKKDIYTPLKEHENLLNGKTGKGILKERVDSFRHKVTDQGAYNEDILKQPQLCNEAILMCINAYDKKQNQVGDWEITKRVRNRENGFAADVYKRGEEIAIAYGATDDKMDIITDIQMASGVVPNQFEDAYKLFKEIREDNPDTKIVLTGTSLGGSLACLIASVDKNTKAITFNAYGVKEMIRDDASFEDNGNSYNYITKGDPISRSCNHIGNVIVKKQSSVISHSISNFFGFFNQN